MRQYCPGSNSAFHLINRDTLALMKPSAVLINCARGAVVDYPALREALENNKIAGAAIDVFEVEPPVDDPILKLPNVVASPHVGGTTFGIGVGMIKLCVSFIESFDKGEGLPLENIVNYRFFRDPSVIPLKKN